MTTKIVTIPKNVPTATIKEAIQKYLKENDETEVVDRTLGKTDHYANAERDEEGKVHRPDQVEWVKELDAKGALKRIIAKVKGQTASALTVKLQAHEKLVELKALVTQMEADQKQDGLKEPIFQLFGPMYEFETRIIEFSNTVEIVLAKQPKATETPSWSSIYKDLFEILTPELKAKAIEIRAMHTTIGAPKSPALTIKKLKTESVASDTWDKVKSAFAKFSASIKSWGKSFSKKLEGIEARAKAL